MDLRQNNPTKTYERKTFFHSNPVVSRMKNVTETAGLDEKAAGYGRIMAKTAYFLLMTVVGLFIYLTLDKMLFSQQPKTVAFNLFKFHVQTSAMTIGIFVGVSILAIIMQIVAAFAKSTVPVTGTIYTLCQGFIISFIIFTVLGDKYSYLGLLALMITIVVVLCMGFLYAKRIIKVTKKFHMVIFTLFAASVGISIFSFIGYLIPLTRPFVATIMGNFWISIGFTLLSIVLASLFLISDFAMIDYVVENRLPAKYEWSAAFGLAFTVLWIYIKILDLLIKIVGNSKSNN